MQNGGYQGVWVGNGELLFDGYKISVWDDEKVMDMDNGDELTTT